MACWAQEIFGPVASLRSFETEAEAVAEANACDRGLAAYLFSQDYAQVGDRRRWWYSFIMVQWYNGTVVQWYSCIMV